MAPIEVGYIESKKRCDCGCAEVSITVATHLPLVVHEYLHNEATYVLPVYAAQCARCTKHFSAGTEITCRMYAAGKLLTTGASYTTTVGTLTSNLRAAARTQVDEALKRMFIAV